MVIEPCQHCNKYHTGIMCGEAKQTETVGGTYYSRSEVKTKTKRFVTIEKYNELRAKVAALVDAAKAAKSGLMFLDSQGKGNEHTYQQIKYLKKALDGLEVDGGKD